MTLAADAGAMPFDALIAQILARYHAVHRHERPALIRLARQVGTAHPGDPAAPHGLADLPARMAWEMEAHMQKEEQGLFPMRRPGGDALQVAMELMRHDHEEHAGRLNELAALTGDHAAPAAADEAWRRLCAGTAQFLAELREHLRLENDVLFPACGG
jgi:regulator of cell morphogenesis and NO signaling